MVSDGISSIERVFHLEVLSGECIATSPLILSWEPEGGLQFLYYTAKHVARVTISRRTLFWESCEG